MLYNVIQSGVWLILLIGKLCDNPPYLPHPLLKHYCVWYLLLLLHQITILRIHIIYN